MMLAADYHKWLIEEVAPVGMIFCCMWLTEEESPAKPGE